MWFQEREETPDQWGRRRETGLRQKQKWIQGQVNSKKIDKSSWNFGYLEEKKTWENFSDCVLLDNHGDEQIRAASKDVTSNNKPPYLDTAAQQQLGERVGTDF